jgi:hypothetical protein
MKDEHQIVLIDPGGKQHILPIDLQRLQGLRLVGRKGSEDLRGHEDLVVLRIQMRELAALDPEKFVIMACQLYATQRDLQQPPSRADDSVDGKALAKWFERVVSHAEQAPIGDPWADFVTEVINTSPDTPEAS